ncbi:MAG: corrinoid activation/regeneration protein AcsV [Candidatus Choladocola sp.]|nr:corrinoid activation/regeneration protein AcsV [Candidatus Choladocola sp.]
MPKVTFQYEDGTSTIVDVTAGENLLEVARKANVAIDAPCSGNGSCGKCRVRYISGELESEQTIHITDEDYAAGWRLSCCSKVTGDVTVLVPDIASAYKSRMKVADLSSPEEVAIFDRAKQDVADAGITFENEFTVVELQMTAPSLDDTMPDNERLSWAIEAATGIENVKLTYQVLKKLPDALRDNDFHVNVVLKKLHHSVLVYDVVPVTEQRICGAAIDIGTTTVSGVILDLRDGTILAKASAGNGQIRYGADVINRIIESRKPGGEAKLQKAIIDETLNPMLHNMCRAAGIKGSQIYHMCIASNTTMNHLLLGVNADPLRMEPYIPDFFETEDVSAYDLHLDVHPNAKVIISPNIGSYVGGDITAGTLVSMIWNKPEFNLFIDLGTNGEIVFGNSDFMMSCACSAGPAFEGGDISCGMRATDGAIEACSIDAKTMEPTLHIVGNEGQKPVGLCGSGIIDVIAELFRCGIISPKGKFIREGDRVRHDHYGIGSYVLAFKEEAAGHKDVEINEVDIDNFIRAKGAIFSAICTMLRSLDFDVSMIENVYVAGGIGSGINMKNAVTIGMFPDVEIDKFHYIGNSSLTGAYNMTLSVEAEHKVHELAHNITYMELSTDPSYMDEFVAACFIPHTNTALFPSVKQEEI